MTAYAAPSTLTIVSKGHAHPAGMSAVALSDVRVVKIAPGNPATRDASPTAWGKLAVLGLPRW